MTSTRSTLLMRAVEDCFIGRHFLFGIKVERLRCFTSVMPVLSKHRQLGIQSAIFISGPRSLTTFLNNIFLDSLKQRCCILFVTSLLLFFQLSDTEQLPWVGITATKNSCRSTGKVQVIASQMIPPQAPLLGGCTVVSYYQILLQKAAECELQLAESSTYRPPRASPLLKRHHAEAGGFEHDASGFFSLSLQR